MHPAACHRRLRMGGLILLACASAVGQASVQQSLTPIPSGRLHVELNNLVDQAGRLILLRGTEVPDLNSQQRSGSTLMPSEFPTLSATTFSVIRLRWNMNTIRLPVNVQDYENDPSYLARVAATVARANELELLVILAAKDPRADLPSELMIQFWRTWAAYFKDNPRVLFDVFSAPRVSAIPDHASDWRFWRHGGTGFGARTAGMQELVDAIRSAGAAQPIIVMAPDDLLLQGLTSELPIHDPNIIYEVCPRYNQMRTEKERDDHFGFLAGRVPILANNWDLDLDEPSIDCHAIPPDPSLAGKLVSANLDYFDAHRISWTVSSFRPGKLITDYRYYNATTLDNGWTCGQPTYPPAGMGILVQFHLWRAAIRGLFTVNNPTGNFMLARDGLAVAYGPILAKRDSAADGLSLPKSLSGISVRVIDSLGVDRLAPLRYVSAGWGIVNFIVPSNTALGPAQIMILRSDGTSSGSHAIVDEVAPGLQAGPANGLGPAVGWVTQTFANGRINRVPTSDCKALDCRTIPIQLAPNVRTTLRLRGTGFRNAGSLRNMQLKIGGVPVPITWFGPVKPGVDELTATLTPELRGLGETDMILSVNGRLANVVRINIE